MRQFFFISGHRGPWVHFTGKKSRLILIPKFGIRFSEKIVPISFCLGSGILEPPEFIKTNKKFRRVGTITANLSN